MTGELTEVAVSRLRNSTSPRRSAVLDESRTLASRRVHDHRDERAHRCGRLRIPLGPFFAGITARFVDRSTDAGTTIRVRVASECVVTENEPLTYRPAGEVSAEFGTTRVAFANRQNLCAWEMFGRGFAPGVDIRASPRAEMPTTPETPLAMLSPDLRRMTEEARSRFESP